MMVRGRVVTMVARALVALAAVATATASVRADGAWLDADQHARWNQPGMILPSTEADDTVPFPGRTCSETARPAETAEDAAVRQAGWFLTGGLGSGWGIRIVGGNGSFDGMCRPVGYQYFVFVDGEFAGTVSPVIMNSRFDGAAGGAWVIGADTLIVEFARYGPADPFCCPSAESIAIYQVERTTSGPVLLLLGVLTQHVTSR